MSFTRYIYRDKVSVGYRVRGDWVLVAYTRRRDGERHEKAIARGILNARLDRGGDFCYSAKPTNALTINTLLEHMLVHVKVTTKTGLDRIIERDLLKFVDSFDYYLDTEGKVTYYFQDKYTPPQHVLAPEVEIQEVPFFTETVAPVEHVDVKLVIQKEPEEYPYMVNGNRVRFFHCADQGFSVGFFQDKRTIQYTLSVCSKQDKFSKAVSRHGIHSALEENNCAVIYKMRGDPEIMSYQDVLQAVAENLVQVAYNHEAFVRFNRKRMEKIADTFEALVY